MKSSVLIRLVISALIAFCSYAAWAYYANSLVSSDHDLLIKSALVQGTYSASITLFFTVLLEFFYHKFGANNYCLAFITPRINIKHSKKVPCATLETFKHSLEVSEQRCNGTCLPGLVLSPLPALFTQALLVISVNIIFNTPNLWLTVAPSIIFSAIYGYVYSFGLARKALNLAND